MKYARIINEVAVDVTDQVPGLVYTPEVAAQFVMIADDIAVGWVRLDKIVGTTMATGKVWKPPHTTIVEFEPGKFQYETGATPPPPVFDGGQVVKRHVTVLAFRHRFTLGERVAITFAGKQNTLQGAAIQVYMDDVQAASYIDLDRIDTRDGVLAMEPTGLLAAGRALEILDAPIQPHERPLE